MSKHKRFLSDLYVKIGNIMLIIGYHVDDSARARRACAAELHKILRILHLVIEVQSKKT
jgi:hypothetical protein